MGTGVIGRLFQKINMHGLPIVSTKQTFTNEWTQINFPGCNAAQSKPPPPPIVWLFSLPRFMRSDWRAKGRPTSTKILTTIGTIRVGAVSFLNASEPLCLFWTGQTVSRSCVHNAGKYGVNPSYKYTDHVLCRKWQNYKVSSLFGLTQCQLGTDERETQMKLQKDDMSPSSHQAKHNGCDVWTTSVLVVTPHGDVASGRGELHVQGILWKVFWPLTRLLWKRHKESDLEC